MTPVPPGDFAAALAGLLVAPDAVAAPPIAPADRQIAAMPGKDLPAIAVVAGAIDIAPETATLAAEAVSDEAMPHPRSEEHTSELQSLMRISYAVFCLKKKTS